MENKDVLLSIKDLKVDYSLGKRTLTALDGISLEIGESSFVAVVGESGCGKSTLALSIIGLLASPPSKIAGGSIEYKSTNLLSLKEKQRRQYRGTEIAMIFQEPMTSLDPVYKIGDQLAEAIAIREIRSGTHNNKNGDEAGPVNSSVMQKTYPAGAVPLPSKIGRPRRSLSKMIRADILDALRRVRIADPEGIVERYPFELSGGMRQRVMIAMALSQKPALLIADEPTTALDVTTQAQVLKLMKALMEEMKTSVLLITHDLAVACQVADRIIVMYAGDIVEDANVFDFFSEPKHPYSKGLLSCIPSGSKKQGALNPIRGSIPNLAELQVGCKYASRCPYVMEICKNRKPTLKRSNKDNHMVACFLYSE